MTEPELLPRARAVLLASWLNHNLPAARSGLPARVGPLTYAALLDLGVAIDKIWKGSEPTYSPKNNAYGQPLLAQHVRQAAARPAGDAARLCRSPSSLELVRQREGGGQHVACGGWSTCAAQERCARCQPRVAAWERLGSAPIAFRARMSRATAAERGLRRRAATRAQVGRACTAGACAVSSQSRE